MLDTCCMGKRAAQLILIALAGALIAWWLTRDSEPAARKPVVRAEVITPSPAKQPAQASNAPRESRFKLPDMPASKPQVKIVPAPPPPSPFAVPKNWHLRGSASKNYELRSDRASVFSGNASAVLRSHEGEVQPNLTGSAVQAVLAGPYVGQRVELTMAMRATSPRDDPTAMAWMYVTDPARVVIAYQLVQMRIVSAQPKSEWRRYRVVMDVPWHGEVLAYGFSLQGRGALWVDDVRLTAVDPNVPLTGAQNSYQLGVIAQAVSADGALANPSNLDFEDVQVTRERQEGPPRDTIDGTRF
jgi:hypothetical protein